jgi:hypothetical protein
MLPVLNHIFKKIVGALYGTDTTKKICQQEANWQTSRVLFEKKSSGHNSVNEYRY